MVKLTEQFSDEEIDAFIGKYINGITPRHQLQIPRSIGMLRQVRDNNRRLRAKIEELITELESEK